MLREGLLRSARGTALLTALLTGCCPGTSFGAFADGQDAVERLAVIAMGPDRTDEFAEPQAWFVMRRELGQASKTGWRSPSSPLYGGAMPEPGDRGVAIRVLEVSGAARLRVVLLERSAIDQVLDASPAAGSIGSRIDAAILSDVSK